MKNLKKYILPIALIAIVVGLLLWSIAAEETETTQKSQTAVKKNQLTTKVEGSETTSQSENYQLSRPETQTQPKAQGSNTQKTPTTQPPGSTNEAGIPIKEVALKIEAGSKGTHTFQVPWENGDNVWTILQRASQLKHFSVEHDDVSYKPRIYVTDIYDTNIEKWTFKVNGTCSNVAANSYSVSENDSILWSINYMCS